MVCVSSNRQQGLATPYHRFGNGQRQGRSTSVDLQLHIRVPFVPPLI